MSGDLARKEILILSSFILSVFNIIPWLIFGGILCGELIYLMAVSSSDCSPTATILILLLLIGMIFWFGNLFTYTIVCTFVFELFCNELY